MLAVFVAASIFASPAYYPEGARRRGEEGVTKVQLDVSPSGKPELCRVIRSSGSAELDASACELVQTRMTYPPQFDAQGTAVRSIHDQSVRWQLKSDPEEERRAQPVRVPLATIMAAFLVYLPMSLLHAFQAGDFWPFEKAGRFSLLRAASRTQSPSFYWTALTSRALAIIMLSFGLAQLLPLMSPANVRVSPDAVQRP